MSRWESNHESVSALPSDELWRTSRHQPPADRPHRRPTCEFAVVGILLAWNLTANLVIPGEASLPLSVVAVTLLFVVARRTGLPWGHLGLRREFIAMSLRAGAAALGFVVATIAVVVAIPASREYLSDERFIGIGTAEMLYETLVRIPIGTALAEELAFRGVVLGMLVLWISPLRALVMSSVLFGLWHVLPAIQALETNPAADLASGALATVGEIAIQVVVTGIVGAAFAWLRFRGRSIAGPALAHWGLNGAAYFAGWLVVRNAWA